LCSGEGCRIASVLLSEVVAEDLVEDVVGERWGFVDRCCRFKVLAKLLVLKGWCLCRRYGSGGDFDQGAHCGDRDAVVGEEKERIEIKNRRLRPWMLYSNGGILIQVGSDS
jgi:hypothetical protein